MDQTEELQQSELFRSLLHDRKFVELRTMAGDMNEPDLAAVMEAMEDEDMLKLFRILPKQLAADVFSLLEPDSQQYIITQLSDKEAGAVIDNLYADDATDLLEEMPANVVKRILSNARPDTRKDINHLLQYPDDSAGSIMATEFVDLKETMTAQQALEKIRRIGMDSETANICYVLDAKRLLLGTVSLRHLILQKPEDLVRDFMHEDVVSVSTTEDQEHVASVFKKYDLTAMPVVDNEGRMVGIITVDDIIDIIEEETTEDIDKMGGVIPSDKPYLKSGVIETWKKRIPWLLLLMISATFTGRIITGFESALARYVVLTAYIPMLMDTGGNSGSQASTEVVRSLSLEQIGFRDFGKVIWKESRVGLLCGATLSLAAFGKCLLLDHTTLPIATAIAATIVCVVFIAKVVASTLVFAVKRAHLDPAVVASPMLTTIVDAISLLIYFTIATTVLQI